MNPGGSSFSPLRIPKQAGLSLLRTVPLYVLGSLAILVFSAGFYVRTVWGEGAWLTIGSWSLFAAYVLVGLVGGIAAGLLSAAHRTLDTVEAALHAGLRHLPAFTQNPGYEPFSLDEARTHYTALLDRILNQTLGYLPLPAWLEGMIRSSIHDTMVADFITLCRERGLTRVPPQEFRNWVLAKGATLALSPLRDQMSLWQYALFGLIGLLAAGALLLSYFAA